MIQDFFLLNFKRLIPWWGKIAAKIVLNRIPISYHFLSEKLGVARHGDMLEPEYAWQVFYSHYSKTSSYLPEKFVVCELGPGDSLATAMIAPCYGAKECYLSDAGNFATYNVSSYVALADFLSSKQISGFNFNTDYTQNEFLRKNNASYLTTGVDGLQKIPNDKIDFLFSQAVLEHIHLKDFTTLLRETYRILKRGGIASHKIDLKDHLGGVLNNLRFSKKIWESKLFLSSGFYTNRLRASEITKIIQETGFKIINLQETRWECLPMPLNKLSIEFSGLSEDDLLISGVDFVLQK